MNRKRKRILNDWDYVKRSWKGEIKKAEFQRKLSSWSIWPIERDIFLKGDSQPASITKVSPREVWTQKSQEWHFDKIQTCARV